MRSLFLRDDSQESIDIEARSSVKPLVKKEWQWPKKRVTDKSNDREKLRYESVS